MGEANQRGSYEDRKSTAIRKSMEKERENDMVSEEKQVLIVGDDSPSAAQIAAQLMASGALVVLPYAYTEPCTIPVMASPAKRPYKPIKKLNKLKG